jgi:hypothetical protein|tara:strand:- start:122 stop:640 length:519 start_codon:yes stop_codon:yes gene_type:complete
MGISILKNVSVSLLLILAIGCELPTEGKEVGDLHGTAFVAVEYIPELQLSQSSWQTLYTMGGEMWSDEYDVTYTRIEWESDMYWKVHDANGYFKLDCRGCSFGTWYDTDGSTQRERLDEHTMAPVTNQVSLVRSDGTFNNVLAPVQSMDGKHMWLWWSTGGSVIDSMAIYLN